MNSEQEHLFNLIKQAIKHEGLTYKDLATHLSCSESTVKRSFSENKMSVDRMFDCLKVLKISLPELLELWDRGFESKIMVVPKALDCFFAKHFDLFCLFRDLQKLNLLESDLPTKAYSLEDLEMLYKELKKYELTRNKKIHELRYLCLKFPEQSQTKETIKKEWGLPFFKEALSDENKLKSIIWSQHLPESDVVEFEQELTALLNKYTKRSSIYKTSLRDVEPEFSLVAGFGFKTFETGKLKDRSSSIQAEAP